MQQTQTYTYKNLIENEDKLTVFVKEINENIADLKKNGFYETAAIQIDALAEVMAAIKKMLN